MISRPVSPKRMHEGSWKIIHCRAKQRSFVPHSFLLGEKIKCANQRDQQSPSSASLGGIFLRLRSQILNKRKFQNSTHAHGVFHTKWGHTQHAIGRRKTENKLVNINWKLLHHAASEHLIIKRDSAFRWFVWTSTALCLCGLMPSWLFIQDSKAKVLSRMWKCRNQEI